MRDERLEGNSSRGRGRRSVRAHNRIIRVAVNDSIKHEKSGDE